MNSHPLVINIDNHTGHDRAGFHVDGFQTFFKKLSEGFAHEIFVLTATPGRLLQPPDRAGSAYICGVRGVWPLDRLPQLKSPFGYAVHRSTKDAIR